LLYIFVCKVLFLSTFCQAKGGDTSTAESGSDVDDVVSPKVYRGHGLARLTPVHEEVSPLNPVRLCVSFVGISKLWDV